MTETKNNNNKKTHWSENEDYGYYYYPHRNQDGVLRNKESSVYETIRDFGRNKTHTECMKNAHLCAIKSEHIFLSNITLL